MRTVLLDANVIIWAHRFNKFESILKNNNILITEKMKCESKYYKDPITGEKIYIDFEKYKKKLKIIKDASLNELIEIKEKIKNHPVPEIHEPEISCIAIIKKNKNYKFCLGDTPAIVIIGFLGLSKQAISAEELIGNKKNMDRWFEKEIMDERLKKGRELRMYSFSSLNNC